MESRIERQVEPGQGECYTQKFGLYFICSRKPWKFFKRQLDNPSSVLGKYFNSNKENNFEGQITNTGNPVTRQFQQSK